jgi:hypothetical protein
MMMISIIYSRSARTPWALQLCTETSLRCQESKDLPEDLGYVLELISPRIYVNKNKGVHFSHARSPHHLTSTSVGSVDPQFGSLSSYVSPQGPYGKARSGLTEEVKDDPDFEMGSPSYGLTPEAEDDPYLGAGSTSYGGSTNGHYDSDDLEDSDGDTKDSKGLSRQDRVQRGRAARDAERRAAHRQAEREIMLLQDE